MCPYNVDAMMHSAFLHPLHIICEKWWSSYHLAHRVHPVIIQYCTIIHIIHQIIDHQVDNPPRTKTMKKMWTRPPFTFPSFSSKYPLDGQNLANQSIHYWASSKHPMNHGDFSDFIIRSLFTGFSRNSVWLPLKMCGPPKINQNQVANFL